MQGGDPLVVKKDLKKHLLLVFMSALYYNASATIKYLENRGQTKNVLVEVFRLKKSFKSTYERKVFIIGVTQILTVLDAPATITDAGTITRLIDENLGMMEKVKKKEAKEAAKKASK